MAVDSACSNRLPSLKFVDDTLLVSSLISLMTFDLLTLTLVLFISCGVGNLRTNFDVSGTFRSRHMGQQLPDGPRDLLTLTFDLGDHGICRRYGSLFSICTPIKFEVRRPFHSENMTHFRPERPGHFNF